MRERCWHHTTMLEEVRSGYVKILEYAFLALCPVVWACLPRPFLDNLLSF